MNTQTRRQREFQQREQLFIETARTIIRGEGASALTMDKIADLTEYAKGTVYKHFTCKEDILCALCLDSLSSLNDYFRRASEFQGSTRSRIIYLGVGYHLYTQAFPEEFDILISARTNNIREKASPERLERMEAIDALVMSHMRGIMESALQEGDLTLPPGSTVDDLCFGMWAMSFGLLVLEHARDMVTGLNLSPAQHIHLTQMNCLLDGYRWQPLSTEHDYAATYLAAYQYLQPTVSTE